MVQKSPRAASNSAAPTSLPVTGMDRFFKITSRGSTVAREVRGGLVTFFSMAYIIALNPIIIGSVPDKEGNLISGLPLYDQWPPPIDEATGQLAIPPLQDNVALTMAMVAAVTAVIAGLLTLLMGIAGRFPVALAAGLGINAMVAYNIAQMMTWPQAMSMVVWEGIIISILVLTKFRKAVMNAVPKSLRTGISVGIGLFIALIGLVNAGFIRQGAVMGSLGLNGSIVGWPLLVFVVVLIALIIMWVHRVKGAMLIAILGGTVLAVAVEQVFHVAKLAPAGTNWMSNVPRFGSEIQWLPNLELLKFWEHIDMIGAFSADLRAWLIILLTILALMLADFFDTIGTIVAVGKTGGILQDDGNPPRTQQILLVDSIGAIAGGLFSTSSNTSYIESAAGVSEGARTGLASIVTGLAFLVAVFVTPLVNLVPGEAVAPVLVVVGFLMLQQVTDIEWTDLEVAIPAFFMITMMAFTYSITVGMGLGFIVYLVIKLVKGKAGKVSPLLWIIGLLFLIYFMQGLILRFLS